MKAHVVCHLRVERSARAVLMSMSCGNARVRRNGCMQAISIASSGCFIDGSLYGFHSLWGFFSYFRTISSTSFLFLWVLLLPTIYTAPDFFALL